MTNQPAALERVLDSIKGVSTQGFLVFEAAMLVMVCETNVATYERPEKLMVI